jgi:hypothetical protein
MHTRGSFAPGTEDAARERYEALGSTAQAVVKEVAKAMEFDKAEYDRRVTPAVVETARDALFASSLAVTVGTREEYEAWLAERDYEAVEVGSGNVRRVAWHGAPFAGEVAAATFENEEDAVATLRRQAFGRIYRDRVTEPV